MATLNCVGCKVGSASGGGVADAGGVCGRSGCGAASVVSGNSSGNLC